MENGTQKTTTIAAYLILFDYTVALARTAAYYSLTRREAKELIHHANNSNKDKALYLSCVWLSVPISPRRYIDYIANMT